MFKIIDSLNPVDAEGTEDKLADIAKLAVNERHPEMKFDFTMYGPESIFMLVPKQQIEWSQAQ
jgi:hypothetical protein